MSPYFVYKIRHNGLEAITTLGLVEVKDKDIDELAELTKKRIRNIRRGKRRFDGFSGHKRTDEHKEWLQEKILPILNERDNVLHGKKTLKVKIPEDKTINIGQILKDLPKGDTVEEEKFDKSAESYST